MCRVSAELPGGSGMLQWYFSFGANMSPQVLKRRGLALVGRSVPGLLPQWRLCFDYIGYEHVEPRFANIASISHQNGAMPVHGVAHEVSASDLGILDGIEDEGVSYARVRVPFQGYDGSVHFAWAYTALPGWVLPGLPSARYLHIMRCGAKAHRLHESYVNWLSSQPYFDFSSQGITECSRKSSRCGDPVRAGGPFDFWHRPGDTCAAECAVLRIAGRAFYVPRAAIEQRSFLRGMLRDGGTVHALKILSLAYGDCSLPNAASSEDAFSSAIWTHLLSDLQQQYVKCWVRYMEAHFCECAQHDAGKVQQGGAAVRTGL